MGVSAHPFPNVVSMQTAERQHDILHSVVHLFSDRNSKETVPLRVFMLNLSQLYG